MSNRVSIALAMKLTQSIDKLSKSSEYRKWAALLKAIFMGHKGATGNLTVWDRVFAEDAANEDRDSQAFAGLIINQSIDITASALLLEIDPSEQNWALRAWNLLKEHFQSDMAANRQRLQQDINTRKLRDYRKQGRTEEEAMGAYIADLQLLRAELNLAGGSLKEQDLTRTIRMNLPKEYNQAVISLATLDAEQDTIKKTSTFLKSVAGLIKRGSRGEGRNDALSATNYRRGRGGYHRGRGNRGRRGGGRGGHRDYNKRDNNKGHRRNQQSKQDICFNFRDKGECTRKNCRFVHSKAEHSANVAKHNNGPCYPSDYSSDDEEEYARHALLFMSDDNYIAGGTVYNKPSQNAPVKSHKKSSVTVHHSSQSSTKNQKRSKKCLSSVVEEKIVYSDTDDDCGCDENVTTQGRQEEDCKQRQHVAFSIDYQKSRNQHYFIADSGSSSTFVPGSYMKHMTNLTNLTRANETVNLPVGKAKATKRGDLRVTFFADGRRRQHFDITLQNALVVPELTTPPLLSMSALLKTGQLSRFEFLNGKVNGYRGNRRVIRGEATGNLYEILFVLPRDSCYSADATEEETLEQSSPTLQQQKVTKGSQKSQQPKPLIGQSVPSQDLLQLHRTVDHASTSTLRRLVKNGSIKVTSKTMQALKDTPSITSLCEDCAKTKSIKKPLPKTSTPPLEKSDGKWHCDLKGQLITSGGGSRYVLQAAHARTGWDYSYFLPLKSDAPAALELLRVKAERDGHPIKILQLDNGGEFDSDEIDKWAREHEIKIQRTSPDSSQQNGMAERRIRLHSEILELQCCTAVYQASTGRRRGDTQST